jgi:hypothetical protein
MAASPKNSTPLINTLRPKNGVAIGFIPQRWRPVFESTLDLADLLPYSIAACVTHDQLQPLLGLPLTHRLPMSAHAA